MPAPLLRKKPSAQLDMFDPVSAAAAEPGPEKRASAKAEAKATQYRVTLDPEIYAAAMASASIKTSRGVTRWVNFHLRKYFESNKPFGGSAVT
jgi:hypothetical protein